MLQRSTFEFLKKLKKNNNKDWFDSHKDLYLRAKEDFEQYIADVIHQYSTIDDEIGLLVAKKCVFRIYRDLRFSKDKRPYKTHWAAGINKGGKRVHFPGYYIHVEPGGQTFIGGGIWRPDKEMLHRIRQEIDYNLDEFLSIIQNPSFLTMFGSLSNEEKLVRPPRGYEKDNPAIEFIKHRSFHTGRAFQDKEVLQPDFIEKTIETFKTVKPLNDFIATAIATP